MMLSVETLLFWISILLLSFLYAGFPLTVAIVGAILHRVVKKGNYEPSVSVIVAAHNEEANIAYRIENLLAQDYPPDKLEIIVASDGSTDATEQIVTQYATRGVKLLTLPRAGKNQALNAGVAACSGEILLFTDADTTFDRKAVRELTSNFLDPKVGGVTGLTGYSKLTAGNSVSQGEDLYLRSEMWLKRLESLAGSIVSAQGDIYAIRRELYTPIPNSVTDDFVISTGVVEKGYRLVFDSAAKAYELPLASAKGEFARKVRIVTLGLLGVAYRKRLLNPFRYGFYSLVFFSHKLLRRLVPIILFLLLATSFLASPSGRTYATVSAAQVVLYALAAAGWVLRGSRLGNYKLFYVPFFYCAVNAAALVAIFKLIAGQRIGQWQPRSPNPVEPAGRIA